MSPTKQPKLKQACVFCGIRPGVTRDHVPPRKFFPASRRANLVTVPACHECNAESQSDEDYFLTAAMFSYAGKRRDGALVRTERISPMLSQDRGLAIRIAQSFRTGIVSTPRGLILPNRSVLRFDHRRFNRVVAKIVRGTYYRELRVALPGTAPVQVVLLASEDSFDQAANFISELNLGNHCHDGIFSYQFAVVEADPSISVWLLRFYDTIFYTATTGLVLGEAG